MSPLPFFSLKINLLSLPRFQIRPRLNLNLNPSQGWFCTRLQLGMQHEFNPTSKQKILNKAAASELLPETLSKECSLQTAIWVDLSKMTILFKITSQNKNCLEETKLSNPKQNYIELPRIFLLYHLDIFITIF
jgi:hypothetical protein